MNAYRHTARFLLALSALLAAAPTSASAQQTSAAQLLKEASPQDRLGEMAALDAVLVDSRGQRTTLGDCLNGKPLVLQFVYYGCPMLCNLSRQGLQEAAQQIGPSVGEDYTIVTVSFDPRDDPNVAARAKQQTLAAYGRSGAEPAWRFLTGEEGAIAELSGSVGFGYAWDEAKQQYAHAAGIYVLTPEGRIARFLGGVDYPPRDLRLGLTEASDGAISSAKDQFLLLCYHYDPATSRYGFAVMSAMRLFGLATVAALAIGIGGLLLRERRLASNRQSEET